MIALLAAVNEPVWRWARNLAALLLALMTLLVVVQIAIRASTGVTLAWGEELSRFMLVWMAFLIAPYAYRMGAHVSITLFLVSLPPKLRTLLLIVLHALCVWVAVVFLSESFAFVERGFSIVASTLPIKVAWVYGILPASLIGIVLCGFEILLRLVMQLREPERDWGVPGAEPLTPLE